jgi:hypothetical protein
MYPSAPRPTKTTTEVTRSGYYLPVILGDSQMLPGRTVVFSDGNDAFRRYRARSAEYQRNGTYENLAVLNKHKLTDDDYKTGVLTRFEGGTRPCYKAGVQHEVLWLASSAALTDWNFQDVRHIIHYDLPSDEVTYVLRSTIARGAQVTTFVNTDHGGGSETKFTMCPGTGRAFEQCVPGDPVGPRNAALQDDALAVATWLLPFLRRTGVSVRVHAAQHPYGEPKSTEPEDSLSLLESVAGGPPDVWA